MYEDYQYGQLYDFRTRGWTELLSRYFRKSPTSAFGATASWTIRGYVFRCWPGTKARTGITDIAEHAVPTTMTGNGGATSTRTRSTDACRSTPAAQSTEQANVTQG